MDFPDPISRPASAPARDGAHAPEPARSIIDKLIDLAPDSILVSDASGRIREVNARTEQMFGWTRNELIGQPIEILVPERFRKAHPAHRSAYTSQPKSRPMGVGLELVGRRKDGAEFPVDIMLSSVETADGPMVLSVVRDVTEQRRAQEAAHRTELQLKLLVESVTDYAIFLLDPEGKVLSWNSGAARIKGYTAQEIVGQHFSRFFRQEDIQRKKPEEALRVARETGQFKEEAWRIRKDGARFWASVTITALRDPAGQLLGFAKVTRDFTDRKKAEESLLLQLSKVLLAEQDVGTLLAAISDSIQDLVPHEVANLALYDAKENVFRIRFLDSANRAELKTEIVIPVEQSAPGSAFNSREPLLLNDIRTAGFAPATLRHLETRGIRSGCWLPLVNRERALGVLMVGSRREAAFTPHDVGILSHSASQVAAAVDNAVAFAQITDLTGKLREQNRYLEEELSTEHSFDEIVGDSAVLKRVLKQVETVAPTDATVLVLGETGTGKELIARAIHRLSSRSDRPFVKLNCAAIPSGLLESELFGHEKGAFTGAISQKIGRLEFANGGTLFLDEVGDIPLELQPKLLRALQEKEFERLGSTRTVHVDVRLIAATNRDLGKMVADKEFRSDLYYRLKVFPVELPALRDRRDDIGPLVTYFVDRHARHLGKRIESIRPDVMHALQRWHWPGNIRELENFLERAVILSKGPELYAPLSELETADEGPGTESDATLETVEREHILQVLRETRGVIAGAKGAAVRLGVKRTTLNAQLKRLGIDPKQFAD